VAEVFRSRECVRDYVKSAPPHCQSAANVRVRRRTESTDIALDIGYQIVSVYPVVLGRRPGLGSVQPGPAAATDVDQH
jgi:hypothetical protein